MKNKLTFAIATLLVFLGSCTSSKNVPYLIDAETLPQEALNSITKNAPATVFPGDLLKITVSSINIDAVRPFNKSSYITEISKSSNTLTNDENRSSYYLVDDNGNIDFPVIGRLKIGGMTKDEINNLITSKIYPKYLTEKPSVDVRFKNFKVSVVGEVRSPGVYASANERMTIFEAIARAGDLNIQGMRENVMLIRTDAKGIRSIHRLDLNDKNLILSPYYDLQQNDVIYVQPNASRARSSWAIPPALTLTLSSIGTLISIATLIVTITK